MVASQSPVGIKVTIYSPDSGKEKSIILPVALAEVVGPAKDQLYFEIKSVVSAINCPTPSVIV